MAFVWWNRFLLFSDDFKVILNNHEISFDDIIDLTLQQFVPDAPKLAISEAKYSKFLV